MAFKINGPIRNGEKNPVWQATATIFQIADPAQQLAFASVYLLPNRQLLAPGTALAECEIRQITIALGDESYTWTPDSGGRPKALLLLQFPPDGWSKDLLDPELTPPDCTCLAGEIPVWSTDTRWKDHFQPAVYFSADPAALTLHSSGISFIGRPKVPWDYRTPLATPVRWNVMLPFVQNIPIGPRSPLYLEIDRGGLPPDAVRDLTATFSSLSARLPTTARWAQLALPSQSLAQPGIPAFSWTITPIFGGQSASGTFRFGQGEVTLTLTDKVGNDPGATGNLAIASPDVTFSTPDAQGNIQITIQSGAAPGPNTGLGVYNWSPAAETVKFTKLEASYDPVAAARSLRNQFSLSEPDPDQDVEPLLLWGCAPLEDGWAQLPFFNLSDSIFAKVFPDLGTPQTLQSGPLAGVVSWGNEDNPGTGEQPWSASLLGVDGLSGTFNLPGDGTKIKSFTLEFVNPSLELNGFLWLATDPPSAADALPSFDNWLRAVTMLPLRSCYPTDPTPAPYSAKFANLDLQAQPDGSAVPTGWTFVLSANANSDAMTNLTKVGAPFAKVAGKLTATPPLVWRHHPALPNIQTLPYTQTLDPPANPSTSRQLAPFNLGTDRWTFTSRAANAAKRWPILSGNQTPVSGVALACLSLPGLRFDDSPGPIAPTVFASADGDPARSWLSAHYRHGLPYADEIYTLSQVGKQDSSSPNSTGAAALARDGYDAFRVRLQAKALLAEAQADEAISVGPPVVVQGLVEPLTWPVSPALQETAYPGSLTLTDVQGGTTLVLSRDTALAGFQGGFNATDPRTLKRADDAAPATWKVIGGCLMAQGSGGAVRDQRGLIRSASSTFNPSQVLTGATGVRTPLTTPDGKTWLLTSVRQSVSLTIAAGMDWQFWFRDLPVASDMTFVRDRSRSKAARGVNDPAAFSPAWTHLNGYEWRMGLPLSEKGAFVLTTAYNRYDVVTAANGLSYVAKNAITESNNGNKTPDQDDTNWTLIKKDALPLLGFFFYPLTLEIVTFSADGSITGLEVLGRLLFQWSPQATENNHANAVIVKFQLDPATKSLTLASIRPDNGDPDRDAKAVAVPAGYQGEWAITPDADPNPARLYWHDVALQAGALVPGGAVLDFFFWGERWQVAIPLASVNGHLSGKGAIPGMTGAVIASEVGLTIDPAADPTKTTAASITLKLIYRWGDTDKVFLNAEETCVVVGPQPAIPDVSISLHGPTAAILPLSGTVHSQNGSVQIGFSADLTNTVPKLWQLLPGMYLSEADPIRGFATMTFSVNGLTGPNGPANQTPVAIRAAFAEILFRSEWGKSLQEPGDVATADDLYGSSAGNIVAGYSCNYGQNATAWTDTLLLNGLMEITNLISWPLQQPTLDSGLRFHIPSVADGPALEHVRHTIRMLFDQHEVPADGLVCGGPNQIFTLAGDQVWKTLVVTEHQLVNVTSDARQQAAELPLTISADRRWTVLQPVRFFGTIAFNRWLGNFMPPRKTVFAIADRVNETGFKEASALYGGRMLELLPDEVLKLHDGLIVEASGAGWVRRRPATATFSPLEFLPGATPGGALMNPNDLSTPFDVPIPQWCLASVPFLGRLLPTPQTLRSLLCYDPVDYLNQVRAGGGHVEPLPLRFANRTDKAAFDIALSSFDLPGNHAFQRLDTASLEESLFRLSTPPAEAQDRELSSVLSTMPFNGPGRLGRPAVLNRVYDSRRFSLPPAIPAFASASAQQIEQFFQIQGFGTSALDYTAFIAGALLLSATFVQASGAGPFYFPAAWLIAPDMADNPEPVTVAVSPYLGLKRFKIVSEGAAVLVSGELLGTRPDGQLDVLARQSWMPPNAEDPGVFQSWAASILQLTAPDSQAAILRLRRLVAGTSEDGTRTATVEYVFQCLPVAFTPPLALTTHPIRTHAARLRFAEGHYGGYRMPAPLLDFEVAPPQVRDVQPVRLEKRPVGADSPADQDWPWGVSALRMRVRYAGSSDQPIGIAAGVVAADDAVIWWQGASQTVQFAVGEEGQYQLPSLFRAAPIQSLTPAPPNPAMPPVSRAPEAPENPPSDPPPPDDYWQSLLLGSADYLIDGSRPGAGLVVRNHLQRQTGDAVVISGGLPIQHRMVRPVPLRKNNKDLREFALRSWAGYFDPETLLVADWNPTGTAFVLPRVDDKVATHQPQQLRATLASHEAGTFPANWDGSVEIEFEGTPANVAGWKIVVQVETASGVLVLQKGQDDSHYAPPPDDPPAAPGSKLAAIIGTLHHGDPVVIAVTAEYVAEEHGLVTVAGYQQRIEFDLLLSKPEQPLLPFRPVYTIFEDPAYNRALVSQTAYAEGLWLVQKTQHRIRLAFDRREYNASSSFAALYADEDAPESLQINPPLGAVLSIKLIRADGTTVRLHDFPSAPNTLIQGSLPELFVAKSISPVPGDSIAGTLNIVQLPLTDPPVLVQSIATVLVAIVEAPVMPAPQAAYGLLRKNKDAVSCVRFAWSPAATNIELVNPDDLLGETVRRRAAFCWRDTVRPTEDYRYAVQKIAPNGSTHSIEDELWIKPDGSGNQ